MENRPPLPEPIQTAIDNLRTIIKSNPISRPQHETLAYQLRLLIAHVTPVNPLPCRVGSLVLPEKITGSSSLEINPDDPKRLQALAEKSAKIFGDIRPHDCPYCIEGRRKP